MPVQILIVTLIVEKIVDDKSKKEKMKKVNAVINVFFGEIGSECIAVLTKFIGNFEELRGYITITDGWLDGDFDKSIIKLRNFHYVDAPGPYDFEKFKLFLSYKKQFMLSMFENQNLLDHDEFTDMLWALLHILDELEFRGNLEYLSEEDTRHILVDIKRAYVNILIVWVHYMQNIKGKYPYLYKFLLKTQHDFV